MFSQRPVFSPQAARVRITPLFAAHTAVERGVQRLDKNGKYAVAGLLAGAANGLFGAGGGMLLVPLLTRWAGVPERRAFATSVAVILPLSIASAVVYWLRGGLSFALAWPYLLGGAIGGIIAGRVFARAKLLWVRRAFGLLILYGGVRAVLLL